MAVALDREALLAKIKEKSDDKEQDESDDLLVPTELINYKQAFVIILKNAKGPIVMQGIKGSMPFINSSLLAQSTVDPNVTSATTLINTYYDLTNLIFNSPLDYVGTIVGDLNNESDRNRIGSALHASWLYSLLCAVPQIIILKTCQKSLAVFDQEPELIKLVDDFFTISIFIVPVTSLQYASDQMALSTGNNLLPIVSQILGISTGTMVAYSLSNGKWGAPDLGLNGVAWAIIVTNFLNSSCFFTLMVLSTKLERLKKFVRNFKEYGLFELNLREILSHFFTLLRKGTPLIIVYGSEIGVMSTVSLIAGTIGAPTLHAQLAVTQYNDILLAPALAIGMTSQFTISNSMSKNKRNIRKFGNSSIALALILPTAYTLLALAIPRIIMAPFVDSGDLDFNEVVDILEKDKLLAIGGLNLALNVTWMVSSQSLVGAGVSDRRMILNGLTVWLGVGAGYVLAKTVGMGAIGLGLGLGAGLLATACLQGSYWLIKSNEIMNENLFEDDTHNQIDESKSREEEKNLEKFPPSVAHSEIRDNNQQSVLASQQLAPPILSAYQNAKEQSKKSTSDPKPSVSKSICILM